eukprot:2802401-Rhodomonas_salina.6
MTESRVCCRRNCRSTRGCTRPRTPTVPTCRRCSWSRRPSTDTCSGQRATMKRVAVDGDAREADEVFCVGDSMSGSPYKIKVWRPRIEELSKYMPIRDLTENTNELRTPMPGKVHSIAVKGQRTLFPGQLHMQDVAVFEDIVGRALTQEAWRGRVGWPGAVCGRGDEDAERAASAQGLLPSTFASIHIAGSALTNPSFKRATCWWWLLRRCDQEHPRRGRTEPQPRRPHHRARLSMQVGPPLSVRARRAVSSSDMACRASRAG